MSEEPTGQVAQTRAEREADFHEKRFAVNAGQRSSSKFYRLTASSQDAMADQINAIEPGSRVLELGCGPNSVAWELLDRGVSVAGIDISGEAIELARAEAVERNIDPANFTVMNAEELEFADQSFDAVIGSSILHHLELGPALEGIRRVLRPGGRAIFYEPLGFNPVINLYRRLTPSERSEDEAPFTDRDLDILRSNFSDVGLEYFHLTSLVSLGLLKTPWFDAVAQRLERVDRALIDRFARVRKYAWVVVITATV